ncbi:hypothetical protein LN470_12955, partial [Xanthomonas phaseoli]|nr:hypothetical protein [Xanthomonas phaseoli]
MGNPLVWAALGRAAIGAGFNAGYEYFSGGSSPGDDLYDWTHPQASTASGDGVSDSVRRNAEYDAYKEVQRAGYQRDPDPCKELRNRIEFLKKINKMRRAWDSLGLIRDGKAEDTQTLFPKMKKLFGDLNSNIGSN